MNAIHTQLLAATLAGLLIAGAAAYAVQPANADEVAQDELIVASKTTRHAIATFCKIHRLLPDEQLTERGDLRHVAVEGTEHAARKIGHFSEIGRKARKSCDVGQFGSLPKLQFPA